MVMLELFLVSIVCYDYAVKYTASIFRARWKDWVSDAREKDMCKKLRERLCCKSNEIHQAWDGRPMSIVSHIFVSKLRESVNAISSTRLPWTVGVSISMVVVSIKPTRLVMLLSFVGVLGQSPSFCVLFDQVVLDEALDVSRETEPSTELATDETSRVSLSELASHCSDENSSSARNETRRRICSGVGSVISL